MTGVTSRRTVRALAVVAVVALLVLAGCSGGGGAGAGDGAEGDGGGSSLSGGDAAGAPSGSYYSVDGKRVVVRSADMTVEIDDYESTLDAVRTAANDHGGYVGDRERESRGPWDGGTIVVEVPPENFSAVRERIAELGRVESESVEVQDFSNEYNDTAARLADLRREERNLERRLNRTDDPDRADDIRAELDDVRRRIRNLEEQRQGYERRAAMSTIVVDVHEPSQRKPPANRPDLAGFGDAFADALFSGLIVVEWVLIVLGYGIPTVLGLFGLGVFATVSVAGWRRIRAFLRHRFGIDLQRRFSRVGRGGRDRDRDRDRTRPPTRRRPRREELDDRSPSSRRTPARDDDSGNEPAGEGEGSKGG